MRNYSQVSVRKNEGSALAAFYRIMPKNVPQRMVIYTKDIQNMFGKSDRSARILMQKLRKMFGKSQWQYISVAEFCEYTGLNEEEVREYLKGA